MGIRKLRTHQEPDRAEKVIDTLATSISFITQHTESAAASLPNLPPKVNRLSAKPFHKVACQADEGDGQVAGNDTPPVHAGDFPGGGFCETGAGKAAGVNGGGRQMSLVKTQAEEHFKVAFTEHRLLGGIDLWTMRRLGRMPRFDGHRPRVNHKQVRPGRPPTGLRCRELPDRSS
ncbi:hypothetical protein ABZ801_35595 [Actinomadura sp. NPDC047616]|uniref:hypothetical protein n=1 Tax=Actinomadura sp. NPDC047616 TaxID=3155914 RepID=UPI00340C24CF